MFNYFAYGFGIESELLLPELVPSEVASEISIRFGKIDWVPQNQAGYVTDINSERMCFFWKGVGTFLARDGREIVIDPHPEVQDSVLRVFVLGAVLGAVLHQRGLLLLHASAVDIGGGAVAFLGEKGQGKSTIAAAMHSRGHDLIADDVVAIETNRGRGIRVFPGFPQLKLWPDSVRGIGMSPITLPLVHPQLEKRAHRIDSGFSSSPRPLIGICVLDGGEQVAMEPVGKREAFTELVRHSYLARHLRATGTDTMHFRQCGAITNGSPIYRLRRPRDMHRLHEMAAILKHSFTNGYHSEIVEPRTLQTGPFAET